MGATVCEPRRVSLWTREASWVKLATDYKARQTGDLVTILLADQFSASTASTVQSQRAFASQSAITQLFGIVGPRSGIANLFSPSAQTTLNSKGQSATTRSLQTTLSGQVVAVLPIKREAVLLEDFDKRSVVNGAKRRHLLDAHRQSIQRDEFR